MKVKITWSCLTLCNPTDYIVHVILQARILEWVALPFSRGSSQPRDQTQVSHIVGGFFYQLSHKGSPKTREWVAYSFSSGSSQPRNQIWVSYIAGGSLPTELSRKPILLMVTHYQTYIHDSRHFGTSLRLKYCWTS